MYYVHQPLRIIILFLAIFFLISLGFYLEKKERKILQGNNIKLSIEIPFDRLVSGEERYVLKEFTLPSSTFLTFVSSDIIGNPSLLHHATLLSSEQKSLYCSHLPLSFYATGTELNTLDISPSDYGIFVGRQDRLTLLVHLANGSNSIESGVFQLTLTGMARKNPAVPIFLSIRHYCNFMGGLANEYTIHGGISHHEATMEQPFIFPRRAKLLGWGGHLHIYGTSLELLRNGKILSILMPTKNPKENVDESVSLYLEPELLFNFPIRIQRGDQLDLKAVYDKPSDLFYPAAMGEGYLLFDFAN